jgi:hypothetical protein
MNNIVEHNQFLKTKPGFIPNKDGPEIKFSFGSKTNSK